MHPYQDPSVSVDDRAVDLLARMTLSEKVDQMACVWDELAAQDRPGAGRRFRVSGGCAKSPRGAASVLNEVQRTHVEDTRLGIPVVFVEEALNGLQTRDATIFPGAIGQAATWNPQLIEQEAAIVRGHMLAIGIRQAFSPLCDVARDPRWGRIEETYGEDPYLVGMIASAFVRGLQGPDPADGTSCTLKHFVGYAASEGGRNCAPSHMGARELREVHGLPFEMAIREGGARGVMVSYQQIDGAPVQASRELLVGLLRDEYGFDGILISDASSIERLHSQHFVAETLAHAAALGVRAGTDSDVPAGAYGAPLLEAVAHGLVTEDEIDPLVVRILRWKLLMGLFDRPYVDVALVPETMDGPSERALARRVATESICLLANNGALPLAATAAIAVIGPNADRPLGLLGDYTYPIMSGAISRMLTLQAGHTEAPELPSVPIVTALDGIRAAAPDATVTYARGCTILGTSRDGFDEAIAAAQAADVAVVVIGDQSGILDKTATVGEGVDSATLALAGVQRELVEAVAATGTPVVAVLTNGRPFVLDWLTPLCAAIVEAWFPGEEGGNAIADVLFGTVNPAGRLPVSMPGHAGIHPLPYGGFKQWASHYVETDAVPVFAFGHGLSYTQFSYANLQIIEDGDMFQVSCSVTNIGARDGDEVVQLYVRDRYASASRPLQELKGFVRQPLAAGQSVRVTFDLHTDRLALYDPVGGWIVEPGAIDVMIGASSADIRLTGEFNIKGDVRSAPARRLTTPVTVDIL